jgi:alcohol dehydrogenase YqhD (iron-dependent ADH family)
MLVASAMGATAFQKGLGAIHALSHPFGGLYDAHHGLLNGIIMPYVVKANRRKIEKDIERAAAYLGIKGGFNGFMKLDAGIAQGNAAFPTSWRISASTPSSWTPWPKWPAATPHTVAILWIFR